MADATTPFNVLKRQLPDLGPAGRAELHQTILRVCNGIDAREATFALSDAALDAGVTAWFGVNKVEAEKDFIRSRMRAAVLAVLEHGAARSLPDAITAIIREVCELDPADAISLDTLTVSADALRTILEQQLDAKTQRNTA